MNSDNIQKLKDLDEILEIAYEKLRYFQKELMITASAPEKFELKQKIKLEILPDIRKYETEYAEVLTNEITTARISEDYAEYILSKIKEALYLIEEESTNNYQKELKDLISEIRNKISQSKTSSKVKLEASLPIIPGILAFILEIDTENPLKTVWQTIKSKFRGHNKN